MCHHRRRPGRGARGLESGGHGRSCLRRRRRPRSGPATRHPGRPARRGPRPCAAPWLLPARAPLRGPTPAQLRLGSGPVRSRCGPSPAGQLRSAPRRERSAPPRAPPRLRSLPPPRPGPPRPAPGPPPPRLLPSPPASIRGPAPRTPGLQAGTWGPDGGLRPWGGPSEAGSEDGELISVLRGVGRDWRNVWWGADGPSVLEGARGGGCFGAWVPLTASREGKPWLCTLGTLKIEREGARAGWTWWDLGAVGRGAGREGTREG